MEFHGIGPKQFRLCMNMLANCTDPVEMPHSGDLNFRTCTIIEPVHEISNNVLCATSKASYQPVHSHSLIRAFASRLSIL